VPTCHHNAGLIGCSLVSLEKAQARGNMSYPTSLTMHINSQDRENSPRYNSKPQQFTFLHSRCILQKDSKKSLIVQTMIRQASSTHLSRSEPTTNFLPESDVPSCVL
jgi:hypothetical protein